MDLKADPDTPLDPLDPEPAPEPLTEPKTRKRRSPLSLTTGGRPRDDGSVTGLTAPLQLRHVPRPVNTTFKSDSPNPSQRPKAAFTWCAGLPEWAKNKVLGYVYRDWPYLIAIPDPTPGERRTEFAYIDKVTGPEMMKDEIDLLNRYGCGRYRVIINEEDSRPGEGKTLCTIYCSGLSNDLKSFPPADRRITDLTQVDLSHPDNRSYVEYLRGRGLLPEQRSEKDKENEMATVTAVSEMTGLVKELVQDRNKKGNDGDGKSLDLIADAAKRSMEMTQKSAEDYAARTRALDEEISKRRESMVITSSTPPAPQESPLKMALEIVQLMNSNKGSDDIVAKFMEQSNKQLERMEVMFKESLNRPQAQPTPIVDRIKDLKDLREISRDLFGDNKEEATIADAAGDLAPRWMRPFIPLIAPLATGLLQAFMAPKPMGAPPVQFPQQQQGIYPPPPPVQFPQQFQPNPGPVAVPQPQPQAQTQMPPQVLKLMQMIELPFLKQIQNPAMTGTDFAGWFVDGIDLATYEQVATFGPEALFQAICAYPPITEELVRVNMPESRVRSFLAEFCDPKWENEEGREPGTVSADKSSTEPGPTVVA
jgi:hypothetical protein